MCGIFIIIDKKEKNLEEITLNALTAMSHRGPDASKFKNDDFDLARSIFMGHNRLSILGLDNAFDQPMVSDDERYILVFNGEIYNYIELANRHQINNLGCDSAVLFELLIKYGENAIPLLNGMWSFGFYDRFKKSLIISRDRVGKKPLYIFTKNGSIIISSEIKGILTACKNRFKINKKLAYQFVSYGINNHSDETFFDGIKSIPAGSVVSLTLGQGDIQFDQKKYWELPVSCLKMNQINPELNLSQLIDEAVSIRMRSDVPVGLLLSGGLDSSVILASLVKQNLYKDVSYYSYVSSGPDSEAKYIDLLEKEFSIKINKITNANFLTKELLQKCNYHSEYPIASASNLMHYKMISDASYNGIRVMLNGQGADEILGGYRKMQFFYIKELIRNKNFINLIKQLFAFLINGSIFRGLNFKHINKYLFGRTNSYVKSDSTMNLNLGFKYSLKYREYLDIMKYSLPHILNTEDKMSMASSVEMRCPFLDVNVIEYCNTLDPSLKFKNGFSKFILRFAYRDILPKDIYRRRDKIGFNVDILNFFAKDSVLDELKDPGHFVNCRKLGFIDFEKINADLMRFQYNNNRIIDYDFLFRVYSLESFINTNNLCVD